MAVLVFGGSIILLLLLWAATISQLAFERSSAIAAALRENRNRAIAFEQYVTRTFEAADFAALHLTAHVPPMPKEAAPAPPRRLSDPVAQDPLFSAVMIADAEGRVRFSTRPPDRPVSVASRMPVGAVQGNGPARLFISAPATTEGARGPVIAFTRPLAQPDGAVSGAVIVEMPVERLVDFTRGAAIRPQDLVSVIRLDGITLARRQGNMLGWGEDLRGQLVMERQMRDPNGSYLGPAALDRIRRYFSHRRLEQYPVFVTVGIGEADVLAEIRSRSRYYHFGMAFLTLAILAFAASTTFGLLRRDRAVKSLAAANRKLREAQRLGRIGDWEYDVAADRFLWSAQMCEMYGRAAKDDVLTLDAVLAYLDANSRDGFAGALAATIHLAEPHQCEVLVWPSPETPSHRRLLFSPVLSPEGLVSRIIGTDQDVTEEKLHEALREDVAHMARVDAINTMAATIAHELAQPLTAAANYLLGAKAYARRQAPGDDALVRGALEQVEDQIMLTRDIMRRARDMIAKKPGGDDTAFLPDVVRDAISLVRMANGIERVEIASTLREDAHWVAADKIQLQQVLINLLRNACEAVASVQDPRVTISSEWAEKGTIKICVADNGPGVPADLLEVFSPFSSRKRSGLGLGLSISRAIIHNYGGRIWIDQSRSQGALLCFTLPSASPDASLA
ncbi:ATP-binding protein [Sphingosinicella sp. BN140058]|uniref:ATP-binding protein n=1 Tax=Sphingosinicella sp. BN140058 TaxID=1892855 RepID=UPI0013EDEF0F|nr:ATP-binding protein [Sphingosinicella sp. BN140058]